MVFRLNIIDNKKYQPTDSDQTVQVHVDVSDDYQTTINVKFYTTIIKKLSGMLHPLFGGRLLLS